MTIDRAIEILNPEHRENYDGMDEVNEACRMGMEALERTRRIPCSEQNKIGDLKYDAQEREKAVVQLRKQWQDAEMFICTMCGHFDHNIVGNIVYGNKNCGEIVGYPYCKKFTPWIPCSERLPKVGEEVLAYSSSRGVVADYYDRGIFGYGDVTHWMPIPELPKEDKNGRT